MKLQPNETTLVGEWIAEGDKVVADATCGRIEWLVSHELRQVAFSPQWGAWETLFQDSLDGRF